MSRDMEKVIFEQLLENPDYFTKAWPYLEEKYFENSSNIGYRHLYRLVKSHYDKYTAIPTVSALNIALDKESTLSQAEYDLTHDIIDSLEFGNSEDMNWLIDETEQYAMNSAIFSATSEIIQIQANAQKPLDKQDKRIKPLSAMPEMLRDALAITFKGSSGTEWESGIENRWNEYQKQEAKLPFYHTDLDDVTNGGAGKGTLNVFMGGVGTGKSLAMISCAAAQVRNGHNVAYFSLELSEGDLNKRFDANMLDIDLNEFRPGGISLHEYKASYERMMRTYANRGKIKYKQYASTGASADTFRAQLNDWKLKDNFIPDAIYVDYLGIAASTRLKVYTENSYTLVKAVAEEMRSLAIEFDVPLYTGAQTTRGGWDSSDITMADTAECLDPNSTITVKGKGSVLLKDLQLGDEIETHSGKTTVVKTIHCPKVKKAYRIRLKSGKVITASADHVFPTETGRMEVRSMQIGTRLNSLGEI